MATHRLLDRDLSWLSFSERVLQEAKDRRVPLYERLRFLAIYSSNLDEFFRVRVASLRGLTELRKKTQKKFGIDADDLLDDIADAVEEQQAEFGKTFRKQILKELSERSIFLIRETELTGVQEKFVRDFFLGIREHLSPAFLQRHEPAPFLHNKALYFAVKLLTQGKVPFEHHALLEIPTGVLPRFIVLPSDDDKFCVMFLDDVIRLCLADVFPEHDVIDAYAVKLTRDAELYIDDEFSGDLVDKIKKGLAKRSAGAPSRFLYDEEMPRDLLKLLRDLLALSKEDLIRGGRYHNFSDFFKFPLPPAQTMQTDSEPRAGLVYDDLPALPHPALDFSSDESASMFDAVTQGDAMLFYPYHCFDSVIRLLEESAADAAVSSIHITLYRVAEPSKVVQALLTALRNGKRVTAFVEVKARFDEEANISCGEALSNAGATVLYSLPGLKVHAKLCLITRREPFSVSDLSANGKAERTATGDAQSAITDDAQSAADRAPAEVEARYVYLSTGNFNEKTASLYSDYGLFTKDVRLTDDVSRVFEFLLKGGVAPAVEHLFVAPFDLRRKFLALVQREIDNARAGKPASMILKMNSLEDEEMIEKLYEASAAGVKVSLIVRGFCRLVSGVKDLSENIFAVSLVDRFLEHGRAYFFHNGGDEECYLASADWMTRNLSRRIEVAFPVYDAALRRTLRSVIDLQLADNTKARLLEKSQKNKYRERGDDEPELRAQLAIYDFLKSAALPPDESAASSIPASGDLSASAEFSPPSVAIPQNGTPDEPML